MNLRGEMSNKLAHEILDQLGPDAYILYPDERHMLEHSELIAIAVACIVAFAKGFLNFEDMGKDARKYLLDILGDLVHHRPHKEPIDMTKVDELLKLIEQSSSPQNNQLSTESLKDSLAQFGMPSEVAAQHAKALTKMISRKLKSKAGKSSHGHP